MSFKKIIMLVFVAMVTFLFVNKPVMNESVVHAASSERIMYGNNHKLDSEELNCDEMFGEYKNEKNETLADALDTAYMVIRIAAVLLTLILGMLDFTKAIWSNDQDGLKKAQQKFVKRLIAMVIIFMLPFIIDPIVDMALSDDDNNYNTCGVGE